MYIVFSIFSPFQVPEEGICLADYCDILRCDIVIERIKRNHQKSLISFIYPHIEYDNGIGDDTIVYDDGLNSVKELLTVGDELMLSYSDSRPICDEKRMKRLKSKCEVIMNQCLLGLLASRVVESLDTADINENDQSEMDEVNHKIISSVCDLLSCDKSWKDFFFDVSIRLESDYEVIILIEIFGKSNWRTNKYLHSLFTPLLTLTGKNCS